MKQKILKISVVWKTVFTSIKSSLLILRACFWLEENQITPFSNSNQLIFTEDDEEYSDEKPKPKKVVKKPKPKTTKLQDLFGQFHG
jgi:hypothetical protein